eukprot:TRINITY_DN12462_c0_g2_i11.p1 TRINITY_DN12462_c0_g2~~TRINITY_DN12462_c0_g2_i11.p1  ORF type:complete len:347 (-),score=61.86 TRINITY_DN12462_c0_g2_i11:154-1194(-)
MWLGQVRYIFYYFFSVFLFYPLVKFYNSVKLWRMPGDNINTFSKDSERPLGTWSSENAFLSIDHRRKSNQFATTAANILAIWDPNRSESINDMTWGDDSLMMVRFNPVETHVVATTSEDRSITLYDIRGSVPIHKVYLDMKTNAVCWNPMEPFYFTAGTEDHNCYTFDMRRLNVARTVHEDHVSAILSLDYSPTGREFVTGSYDCTLRIFPSDNKRSREVYHTKRMQRIFAVQFSGDSKYIFCGSDDTNIRVWKATAHANLEIMTHRQKEKEKYGDALIEKYKHLPEIHRIARKRHVPKAIKDIQKTKGIMKKSQMRKEHNRMLHSKSGIIKPVPEDKKAIVTTKQ